MNRKILTIAVVCFSFAFLANSTAPVNSNTTKSANLVLAGDDIIFTAGWTWSEFAGAVAGGAAGGGVRGGWLGAAVGALASAVGYSVSQGVQALSEVEVNGQFFGGDPCEETIDGKQCDEVITITGSISAAKILD